MFIPQPDDMDPNVVASAVLKLREARLGQSSQAAPSRSGTTKITASGRVRGRISPVRSFFLSQAQSASGGKLLSETLLEPPSQPTSTLHASPQRSLSQTTGPPTETKHNFSEETRARAEKARKYIELSYQYGRLTTGSHSMDGSRHNPLRAIRNRKARARERMQLDLEAWEDVEAVKKWVDHTIEVDAKEDDLPPRPTSLNPEILPAPRIRARREWFISPEEMLADYYYDTRSKKRKSIDVEVSPPQDEQVHSGSIPTSIGRRSRDEHRIKLDGIASGVSSALASPNELDTKAMNKYATLRHSEAGPFPHDPRDGYSSSEEDGQFSSDDDESDIGANLSDRDKLDALRKMAAKVSPLKSKYRRHKMTRSTGANVDAQGNLRLQEREEAQWTAMIGAAKTPAYPVPEYRNEQESDLDAYDDEDEEYHSTAGEQALQKVRRLPELTTTGGLRTSFDFSDVVVPSIAIDLNPPKPKSEISVKKRATAIAVRTSMEEDRGRNISRKASPEPVTADEAALDSEHSASRTFLNTVTLRRKQSPTKRVSPSELVSAPADNRNFAQIKGERFRNPGRRALEHIGDKIGKGLSRAEDLLRGSRDGDASSYPSSVASTVDDEENNISPIKIPKNPNRVAQRPLNKQHMTMPTSTASRSLLGPRPLPDPPVPVGRDPLEVSSDEENGVGRRRIEGPISAEKLLSHDNANNREMWRQNARDVLAGLREREMREREAAAAENEPLKAVLESNRRLNDVLKSPERGKNNGPSKYQSIYAFWQALTPYSEKPYTSYATMVVTKKDLERARLLLLSTGIVAREFSNPAAPASHSVSRPDLARSNTTSCIPSSLVSATLLPGLKQQRMRASSITRGINSSSLTLSSKAHTLRADTLPQLEHQVRTLHSALTTALTPLVHTLSDRCDDIQTSLGTSLGLEVKAVEEELGRFVRKRRSGVRRVVRRAWFLGLEWVVVGFMWWLWGVVVCVRAVRTVLGGVFAGLRWLFWI